MSITSRMIRDDALRGSYEEHQYAFANQRDGASAGTSHVDLSGPFRGQPLPVFNLPEREPTDEELRAIEREQARQYPLNPYPPLPI